jgi:hypothetical protein
LFFLFHINDELESKNMKRRRNENLAKVIFGSIVTLKTDYEGGSKGVRWMMMTSLYNK